MQRVQDAGRERGGHHHPGHQARVLEEREPESAPVAVDHTDQDGDDDDDVDRIDPLKVRDPSPRGQPGTGPGESSIIEPVIYLIGERIPAWGWMSLAFLVAAIGVTGLGWWVLRADSLNRRFEDAPTEETPSSH